MNASPSLQFEVKPGPALTTGQTKAPALVLNATISSPALKISHEAMAVFSDVSHAIPALVFVCLGCLVSIVTVPLSQGSDWARIPVDQWVANMSSFNPPWMNHGEESDTAAQTANTAEEDMQEQQAKALTPIELLTGVSCPAYFPGEQVSEASNAFEEHIWSKLPAEWQAQATERLEVCDPFEPVKPDLIAALGCVQNECGTNDVRFFLTADDKAAVEIYANGQCTHISEPGFRYKKLLCAPR